MGRSPGVEPGTREPQSPSLTNTSLASPLFMTGKALHKITWELDNISRPIFAPDLT